MASGFNYKGTPIEDLYETFASNIPQNLIDAYKLDLSKFTGSSTVSYVEANTLTTFNGEDIPIWGEDAGQTGYTIENQPIPFTKKQTTVFPTETVTFTTTIAKNTAVRKYFRWENSALYYQKYIDKAEKISTNSLVILDIQASGGNGLSGYDTDTGMYGGSGGGGGAFCRILVDFKKSPELGILWNVGNVSIDLASGAALLVERGQTPYPPVNHGMVKGGAGGKVYYQDPNGNKSDKLEGSYSLPKGGKLYILDHVPGGEGGRSYYKDTDKNTAGGANYNGGSGGNARGYIQFGMDYYPPYVITRNGGNGKTYSTENKAYIGGGGGGACALNNGTDADEYFPVGYGSGGGGSSGHDDVETYGGTGGDPCINIYC